MKKYFLIIAASAFMLACGGSQQRSESEEAVKLEAELEEALEKNIELNERIAELEAELEEIIETN